MAIRATTFFPLVLLISGVSAFRSKGRHVLPGENGVIVVDKTSREGTEGDGSAMLEKSVVAEDMVFSAGTRDFCASPRCDGYTDEDVSSRKQLKFHFPGKDLDVDPMRREEVAREKGYKGYHHGLLKDCRPVPNMFSYFRGWTTHTRDWATHMQANLREDIWPNQPGKTTYSCAEGCKLEIFNAKGEQLNRGNETEVWVERDGRSGDLFSKLGSIGWSPATCIVGNALQAHWWKQKFQYSKGKISLMLDPEGLPVFPAPGSSFANQFAFKWKFCSLTAGQKVGVTKRVTKHRPNPYARGSDYDQEMLLLKLRHYFPEGFPRECDDGWNASSAEGVVEDD